MSTIETIATMSTIETIAEKMDQSKELIILAERIRALSEIGLTYTKDEYDVDRYHELRDISDRIVSLVTGVESAQISAQYKLRGEYITPKCEVRAAVFRDDKILLVQELDGRWSLPGGWADIGFSPSEIAVKETKEESGLDVKPVKLVAVTDPKFHNHPPVPHYTYKIFILCEIVGGELKTTFDIKGCNFFGENELPQMSEERVLPEQVYKMFEYYRNPKLDVYFD